MPTTKQILASIDDRLGAILAAVQKPGTAPVPPPAPPPAVPPAPPVVPAGDFTRPRRTVTPAIARTPAELVSAKLVLPFSKTNTANPPTYPTYALGGYESVGLTPYMGTTGERQEIGLVTDAQGAWLCGGSANNMLVQAEAHADVPVHFGKVSLTDQPNASTYSAAAGTPFFDTGGHPVTPEMAHYPSLNFIPYLATGDIRYLEELQAEATFMVINGPPLYRQYDKGLLREDQPRGYAWGLRSLAQAYLATPDDAADHLLPKSYWKRLLDNNRDRFKAAFVESKSAFIQGTRAAMSDPNYWVAPWEQDYLGFVLGWMVWTGQFDDWRVNYEWHMGQAIMRAGFGAKAIGYHWTVGAATDYATILSQVAPSDDANYKAFFRGNLKVAVLNKVPGAEAAFAVADGLAKGFVPYRWSV